MPSQGPRRQSNSQTSRQHQRHLPKQVVVQDLSCESNVGERVQRLTTLLSQTLPCRLGPLQPPVPNWSDGSPASRGSIRLQNGSAA
jgi:hypothetical protein